MPHSLKVKVKCLRYKKLISEKDCDRLLKSIDIEKTFRWISVKDDLPNYSEDVFICVEDADGYRNIYKGFYETNNEWYTQWVNGCKQIKEINPNYKVIAWMHCPPIYTKDNDLKAYIVSDINGYTCQEIVFAKSSGKAKSAVYQTSEFDTCKWTDIKAIRFKDWDKYYNGIPNYDYWSDPKYRNILVKEYDWACFEGKNTQCENCSAKKYCHEWY